MVLEVIRQLFHPLFKGITVPEGHVFHTHLVIIYGAYGVIQHGGYLLGVVHAKADKGEDPKLCSEPSGRRIYTSSTGRTFLG